MSCGPSGVLVVGLVLFGDWKGTTNKFHFMVLNVELQDRRMQELHDNDYCPFSWCERLRRCCHTIRSPSGGEAPTALIRLTRHDENKVGSASGEDASIEVESR